jgi:uncharacterized Zn finger protein (UPF0148 family)
MAMNKNEQARVSPSGRVICPRCGGEMNRHAEKLDYSADSTGASFDPLLGAALMEFHTCPGCKYVLESTAGF